MCVCDIFDFWRWFHLFSKVRPLLKHLYDMNHSFVHAKSTYQSEPQNVGHTVQCSEEILCLPGCTFRRTRDALIARVRHKSAVQADIRIDVATGCNLSFSIHHGYTSAVHRPWFLLASKISLPRKTAACSATPASLEAKGRDYDLSFWQMGNCSAVHVFQSGVCHQVLQVSLLNGFFVVE